MHISEHVARMSTTDLRALKADSSTLFDLTDALDVATKLAITKELARRSRKAQK